jgi:exonuclease III
MKPAKFKRVENRRRQWKFLGDLQPDIAMLQECRPKDIINLAPLELKNEYKVLGKIPLYWSACSAILLRSYFSAEHLTPSSPWLEYLSGYLCLASSNIYGRRILIASVHTPAKVVNDPRVSKDDHTKIKRPSLELAWHNDLAAAALAAALADKSVGFDGFIISGDWNTARLFDKTMGGTACAEFFAMRANNGWCESLRKFYSDEVQTYCDPPKKRYELDHMFTDSALYEKLVSCEVMRCEMIDNLSDHAPIVANFDLA